MKGFTCQGKAHDLFQFDASWREIGYEVLAGVDEAGRGCLAGPVVAGAVILPKDIYLPQVYDSKALSPSQRKDAEAIIKKEAVSFAVIEISPEEIDRTNILQASLKAMAKAVDQLATIPDFIIVDGNARIPHLIPQKTVIGGDSLSLSVAAASILAKVYRDELMDKYHKIYPLYNFKKNKGYPTLEHRKAIKKFGPSSIHRKTFKGVRAERHIKTLNFEP